MGVRGQEEVFRVDNGLAGLRISFVAGREPEYVRNSMLLRALRLAGADVTECVSSLGNYPFRFSASMLRFARSKRADLVFVGFLGHPLVPLIRRFRDLPIVFDAFLSIYDTLALDRGWFSPHSLPASLARRLDVRACSAADLVILDTATHASFFRESFQIPASRLAHIYVGADPEIFQPQDIDRSDTTLRVFFYTTFRRLQGADVVLKAAVRLRFNDNIRFIIGGDGPSRSRVLAGFRRDELSRIQFPGWIPYRQLPAWIGSAHLCLAGHFGTVPKARRVIPGKTFQFLACQRPVIVSEGPANGEILTDGRNAFAVPAGEPEALANRIESLVTDRKALERVGHAGFETYLRYGTPEVIAGRLADMLNGLT